MSIRQAGASGVSVMITIGNLKQARGAAPVPARGQAPGPYEWVSKGPRPLAGPPTRKLARRGQSPGLAFPGRVAVLDRLSIRARLVLLSITLVAMTIGTNVYLGRALNRAAEAAQQSDLLVNVTGTTEEVRHAFSDLRYWMTDLAVSLLTL